MEFAVAPATLQVRGVSCTDGSLRLRFFDRPFSRSGFTAGAGKQVRMMKKAINCALPIESARIRSAVDTANDTEKILISSCFT